ncbi:MAG: hypothetical protein IBJ11_07595 [Phycisphaerales bacterium]|nr:hypothetical protein [Phycisphaerales bacterium]
MSQPVKMVGAIAAALVAVAGSAQAAPIQISDRNSSALIDPVSPAGMFNWTIDGVTNLNRQWFYFRVGDAAANQGIDTLNFTGSQLSDTNGALPGGDLANDTLALQYLGNGFRLEITYVIRGGVGLSGTSDIAEIIKITNTSTAALPFRFFQYSNFQLNGQVNNDYVQVLGGNTAQQGVGAFSMSETVATPLPTRLETGLAATVQNNIETIAGYNLNNNPAFIGPANLAWAFQWNFNILPGRSILISKDKNVVPTPGAMVLVGVAGLLGTGRRRRR